MSTITCFDTCLVDVVYRNGVESKPRPAVIEHIVDGFAWIRPIYSRPNPRWRSPLSATPANGL